MKLQNVVDIYPLSSSQQGMLFHTLAAPNSGVYCEQFSCILSGDVDVSVFERAWHELVQRHEVMRTAFAWEGLPEPLQIVRQKVQLPWNSVDWSHLDPLQQETRFQEFLRTDREQGFSLKQAPLMRFNLIRLSPQRYRFVWSYHHLLLDGWSVPIVFREVLTACDAIANNRPVRLPPAKRYREYIRWLQEQDLGSAKEFWCERLSGFETPSSISLAKSSNSLSANSPPQQRYGDRYARLTESQTQALDNFVKQHRLTLNSVIQGAWSLLLSRYCRQDDVLFGVTVSGRPPQLPGVESMVGMLINTLPTRVKLDSDVQIVDWLKTLHEQHTQQEEFSFSPLVEIQGWSDVPRGRELFESIVVVGNYPEDELRMEQNGVAISDSQTHEQTNYGLTLEVTPDPELGLRISHDQTQFDSESVDRMLGHLKRFINGFVENPRQSIRSIPILTESERQELLVDWNETQFDFQITKCLHQLIEEQVEKTPNDVAVVFEQTQLSYAELNSRSNQVARHLQSLDVGPEMLVGICVERSLEMMVGILGILKAGAAYVPLDPSYPADRLEFMLHDMQAPVLLTQQKLVDRLPQHKSRVVCLDSDWQQIAEHENSNPTIGVTPQNLAYIIFTSGSTGRPKGTLIEHRSLLNYMHWCTDAYQVEEGCGAPVQSSIGFDATITSLFSPLMVGKSVVMLPEENEIEALNEVLKTDDAFSLVKITPAHLELLNQMLPIDELQNSTRAFVIGGEALSAESIAFWREHAPHIRLINEYGPTETVVGCCVYEVTTDTPTNGQVPIGRPIANTQLYILDQNQQPVPVGVAGELYIGGAGVARGYLNRPDLTAERFIADPFSHGKEARMYKTGDLARWCPDGNIEFLGRIDHQVKIRGFRIELGEIESVLSQYPNVRQTAVVVHEKANGDKQLVAYVMFDESDSATSESQSTSSVESVRAFLEQKLPDYMVPASIIRMQQMPLTPSGKIARDALPKPDSLPNDAAESFVAPRNELERSLARIWQEVLGVERIGVTDDFFDLGGHSLSSVRLVTKVQKEQNVALPLSVIFEAPTIERMAKMLSEIAGTRGAQTSPSKSAKWSPLVPMKTKGDRTPLFLMPGGGGSVVYLNSLARQLDDDQPLYVFEAKGLNGVDAPFESVVEIAKANSEAIRRVQPTGPYQLAGHSFGSFVAFATAQLIQENGGVANVIILDTPAPGNGNRVDTTDWDDAKWLSSIGEEIEQMLGQPFELSETELRSLSTEEQMRRFLHCTQELQLLPEDAGIENVAGLVSVYKANATAALSYNPVDFVPQRITLVKTQTTDQEIATEKSLDPTWGWARFSSDEVQVLTANGDHISMLSEPHVADLAAQVMDVIRQLAVGC